MISVDDGDEHVPHSFAMDQEALKTTASKATHDKPTKEINSA